MQRQHQNSIENGTFCWKQTRESSSHLKSQLASPGQRARVYRKRPVTGIAWLGQLTLEDMGSKIWYTQNICYQILFLAFKRCHCLLPHSPPQILWHLRTNLNWPSTMKSWLAVQPMPSEGRSWLDANQILELWPRHTSQSLKRVQGKTKSEHALLQIEIPSRAGFRTKISIAAA